MGPRFSTCPYCLIRQFYTDLQSYFNICCMIKMKTVYLYIFWKNELPSNHWCIEHQNQYTVSVRKLYENCSWLGAVGQGVWGRHLHTPRICAGARCLEYELTNQRAYLNPSLVTKMPVYMMVPCWSRLFIRVLRLCNSKCKHICTRK